MSAASECELMPIMADVDTSESNPTVSDSDNIDSSFVLFIIFYQIQLAMTVATFIYGVTSWYLIRKFRNFNNYVYLNTTLVNICRLIVMSVTEMRLDGAYDSIKNFITFMYFSTVYNYWLLVMCYMFYVDVVKVFDGDIKRKFPRSFLLAWGVPTTGLIISIIMLIIIERVVECDRDKLILLGITILAAFTAELLPLIINAVVFTKLVCSLFFCQGKPGCVVPKEVRNKEKWRRFSTAVAMFMLTNISIVIYLLCSFISTDILLQTILFSCQIIFLSLFVILVKSNRILWHEYFLNRKNRIMV